VRLQQLRYLVAVADHQTITAAAASIPVAQAVVSKALQTLEQELGVVLLRPAGRGVELTEHGREVVLLARQALDGVEQIRNLARTTSTRTTVRIVTWSIIEEVLAADVAALVLAERRFDPVFRTVDSPADAARAVRVGEADFALASGFPADETLERVRLGAMRLEVLCRVDDRVPDPVPVEWLNSVPLILYGPENPRGSMVLGRLARAGVVPRNPILTGDQLAWPSMVDRGLGYALVPSHRNVDGLGLRTVPVSPSLDFGISMVHRRFADDDPLHALRDRLIASLRARLAEA
jgi:DNA-binding transcriptional LysR family regulator